MKNKSPELGQSFFWPDSIWETRACTNILAYTMSLNICQGCG